MYKFGEKVIIRDGSLLDGAEGIVYRIEAERISVLLDKEVFWHVASEHLDYLLPPAPDHSGHR